jgi:hypothetical protein
MAQSLYRVQEGTRDSTALQPELTIMMPIEEAIIKKLCENGPCSLDDIVTSLPNSSWGNIFAAIDRMSRNGRVFLRQLGYSTYQVSLGSHIAYPAQRLDAEGESASQRLEC